MKMEFKIEGPRLIARQIGAGDWQDIFIAAEDTAQFLWEENGIKQLLIDLFEAEVTFRRAEAADLARTFVPLLPQGLRIAILLPASGGGRKEIDVFVSALSLQFSIDVFETLARANAFLAAESDAAFETGP